MDTFLSILHTIGLILIIIMFFNLMIFVHELGHFLAGKWRGAYIDRFQIWFGKPIWSKTIGGVKWGIGWIPAGGFVSLPQLGDMEGIEGEAEIPKDLKPLKPLDKIIIAAAGPLFSLLLAYVFACIVWVAGKPVADIPGARVGYVLPNSPAASAGILPGDTITAIDGKPVVKWAGNMEGVTDLIALSENEKINLTIERPQADGSSTTLNLQTTYTQEETAWWQRSSLRKIGIAPVMELMVGEVTPHSPAQRAGLKKGQKITHVNGTPLLATMTLNDATKDGKAAELTVQNTDGTIFTVKVTPAIPDNWKSHADAKPLLGFNWDSPKKAVTLDYPSPQQQVNQSLAWMGVSLSAILAPNSSVGVEHLSGPIGIGSSMYSILELPADRAWRILLWFAVIINVNLAVLNFLPLPVVDGGHVVLGFAEMIKGKPVEGKFLNWLMTGFIFLILFMFIFVTFKDIGDHVGNDEESSLPPPVFSPPAQP